MYLKLLVPMGNANFGRESYSKLLYWYVYQVVTVPLKSFFFPILFFNV